MHRNECGGRGRSRRQKCRRAGELGHDVLLVPDSLGMPAPFPAPIAAAGGDRLIGAAVQRADRDLRHAVRKEVDGRGGPVVGSRYE